MFDTTDNLISALPFVLAVCLIYWFVRRAVQKKKHGGGFKEFRKNASPNERIRLLFVAWAAECVCVTLFPEGFFYRVLHGFNDGLTFIKLPPQWYPGLYIIGELDDIKNNVPVPAIQREMIISLIKDYILNVFMFVPLGFALPFIWNKANLWRVVLVGFLCSLFIEFAQGFMMRISTIDDVINNTLGALLGYLLYLLVNKLFPRFSSKIKGDRVNE